jgi:rod shape determining protein RodA
MFVTQTLISIRSIILSSVGILVFAGLMVLYDPTVGASQFLQVNVPFLRQLMYVLVGVLAIRFFSRSSGYLWYRDEYVVKSVFWGSLILLVGVLLVGSKVNGARSWFDFGFFSLQPADSVKVLFMLFLAHFYERRHVFIKHPATLLVPIGALAIVAILLLMQPDFGTVVVFIGIWFCITLAAGLWWRHVAILLGGIVVVSVLSWFFVFADYQKARIMTFINPELDPFGAGYNVIQSKVAIGAAGLWGFGAGEGTQGRLGFLPEHHTDFVFASFVEEWGAIGGGIVIIAYVSLVVALLVSAYYSERVVDSLYLVGFAAMIGVHGGIHIGMNMGLLPVTGLPMPFMSFGGSHIVAESIGLGIALSMIVRTAPDRAMYDVEYYGPEKLSLYAN